MNVFSIIRILDIHILGFIKNDRYGDIIPFIIAYIPNYEDRF